MFGVKLAERQCAILNLIRKPPAITGRQMSETLSVSQLTRKAMKHGFTSLDNTFALSEWWIRVSINRANDSNLFG